MFGNPSGLCISTALPSPPLAQPLRAVAADRGAVQSGLAECRPKLSSREPAVFIEVRPIETVGGRRPHVTTPEVLDHDVRVRPKFRRPRQLAGSVV